MPTGLDQNRVMFRNKLKFIQMIKQTDVDRCPVR